MSTLEQVKTAPVRTTEGGGGGGVRRWWDNSRGFLTEVRNEMRRVTWPSRRDGQVTRRISLRTSVRKERELSYHPFTPPPLSVLRTGAGLTCSNVLIATL